MADRFPFRLQRLQLRTLRREDLAEFLKYRSDPHVASLQGWEPMSEQEALDFLIDHSTDAGFRPNEWSQIAIADAVTDRLLGDMGIHLSEDLSVAEFGITISPSAQGNGYAVESIRGLIGLLFSSTPANKVLACTDIRNSPCNAALSRAGMSLVGTRTIEYKGEMCTENIFAVLRPEGQQFVQA